MTNKNCTINDPKKGRFQHDFPTLYIKEKERKKYLKLMHGWEAVVLRISLAPKNHGQSVSAQSYDFCPRLKILDILDFTLSHI